MANDRISDLTVASPFTGAELLELSQPTGGSPPYVSRKSQLSALQAYIAQQSGGGRQGPPGIDGQDADDPLMIPGPAGATGPQGPQGPSGGGGGSGNTYYVGGNITPDSHPSVGTTYDDDFEALTLNAKWTWINQNTSTATFINGNIVIAATADGQNHSLVQAAPVAPWEIACKTAVAASATGSGTGAGLIVVAAGGANYVFLCDSNGGPFVIYAFNSASSFNSTLFSGSMPLGNKNTNDWVYLKIINDGTNLTFYASYTGIKNSYQLLATVTMAAFIGSVANFGIVTNNNVANGVGTFDWYRRIDGSTPASAASGAVAVYAACAVAALPTGQAVGTRGTVTDATATTFLSTVAGGGANTVPVMYNGTVWVIG